MSSVLSIRLPDSLRRELKQHARVRGMQESEAARDLISRGLGTSPEDSGYREGKLAAYRETMRRLNGKEDSA
jgi:hypothetical protein